MHSKRLLNYLPFSRWSKTEHVLDTRELSAHGLLDKIKENSKIELLERLEHPKTGEIIVSYEKAVKLAGWKKIVELHNKKYLSTVRYSDVVKVALKFL